MPYCEVFASVKMARTFASSRDNRDAKSPRYVHLLCGEPEGLIEAPDNPADLGQPELGGDTRLADLENEVARLRQELERIRGLVED